MCTSVQAPEVQESYGVSADAYLARAKARLNEHTAESLFYAAYELRCFVEARQDDYLDAQKEYAKSIPKAYKVGAQGKALESIFSSDQIQYFAFASPGHGAFESYHVPVSPKLRNEAEWLGSLRHAQMKYRPPNDPWWSETRDRVIGIYRLAWICAQGNLPSPLFLVDGNTIGNIRFYGKDEELQRLMACLKPGTRGVMRVDYLKLPPETWQCDL